MALARARVNLAVLRRRGRGSPPGWGDWVLAQALISYLAFNLASSEPERAIFMNIIGVCGALAALLAAVIWLRNRRRGDTE